MTPPEHSTSSAELSASHRKTPKPLHTSTCSTKTRIRALCMGSAPRQVEECVRGSTEFLFASRNKGQIAQKYHGLLSRHLDVVFYFTLFICTFIFAAHAWELAFMIEVSQYLKKKSRAARFATRRWHNASSVTAMKHDLGWEALADRRQLSRVILFYKIHHNLVLIPIPDYLTLNPRPNRNRHHLCYNIPINTASSSLSS